jgi:cytoskeletal protein CcmA (bactofilin family)
MRGNMVATDRVEVTAGARVFGNITAPRVVIADGARFKGHIEMPD